MDDTKLYHYPKKPCCVSNLILHFHSKTPDYLDQATEKTISFQIACNSLYYIYLCHIDALIFLQTQLVVIVNSSFVGKHSTRRWLSRESESRRGINRTWGFPRAATNRASIIRMIVYKK